MATSSVQTSSTIDHDNTYRSRLIKGQVEFLDQLFPLYDFVFRSVRISPFFYYPILFWQFLQNYLIALWPSTLYWKSNIDKTSLSIIGYLVNIFWLTPLDVDQTNIMIDSIVLFTLTAVCVIVIIIQILNYQVNREFLSKLLWPLRIFSDLVFPIFIIPTTVAIGTGFTMIIEGRATSMMWLYISLGIAALIFQLGFVIIMQSLASVSAAISNTPILNFDSVPYILSIIFPVISLVAFYILNYFENWTTLIAIIIHCIFNAYLVYLMMFTPFVSDKTTTMFAALFASAIPIDIIIFVGYFIPTIPKYIVLGLAFVIFVVFSIMFWFIFKSRVTRIMTNLRENELVLNDEEKMEYFSCLGLDKNEKLVHTYFVIGFKRMSPYFLDMSLFKYIISNHSNENLLCTCLQIINFFPSESRTMNRLLIGLTRKRTLSFTHRFLIFQVMKVKILREFSASSDSNIKLNELKTASHQVENMVRGIWDQSSIHYNAYEQIALSCLKTRALWAEAISEYPNNPKFCEEYCRYLVDCECDFPGAVKLKRRGELVELGKNFSIDYSFRSMIRVFPQYLKKGIVDFRGNMKINAPSRRGSSNNSSSNSSGQFNQSLSSSLSSELDNEVEETLGKQTFAMARTRLALDRALQNRIPRPISSIVSSTVIAIISVVILYLAIIIFSIVNIQNQTSSMVRLEYISKTRFFIALSNIQLSLQYSIDSNHFSKYATYLDQLDIDKEDLSFIKIDDTLLKSVLNRTNEAKQNYQKLINSLAELTDGHTDVREIAKPLVMNDKLFIYGVDADDKYIVGNETLTTVVSTVLISQRYLSGFKNVSRLLKESKYEDILLNINSLSNGADDLFDSLTNYQISVSKYISKQFLIVTIVIPILVFILVLNPYFFIHCMAIRSINKITEIIMSFDATQKSEAKNIISINVDNEDPKSAEIKNKGSCVGCYLGLLIIVTFSFLALSVFLGIRTIDTNDKIIQLNVWDRYASQRLSLAAECLNAAIIGSVIADDPTDIKLFTSEDFAKELGTFIKTFKKSNDNLLYGTENSEPCIGYDDVLDHLNIIDETDNSEKLDVHSLFAKSSINQQISIFIDYVSSIAVLLTNGTKINPSDFACLFHLTNSHMWSNLIKVTERLSDLADVEFTTIGMEMFYISIGVIVLILIFILLVHEYYFNWKRAYRASLFVLKRVPPFQLVNNKLFTSVFLNDKEKASEGQLTVTGSIVHNAKDAIFCTNVYGVVEIVNTAATTLLEYTPEQLIGQPAPAFFVPQDEEKITQQLEMMRSGHCSPYFEDSFTALSDSSQIIPCIVTILGMKSNGSDVSSFVMMIRDQTVLISQQKKVEEAKAQSEKLLYQILPRDIVLKLNRCEKDISFSVKSATVIFIDIVRFSEYSATLSPSEIMANLSVYFSSCDKCASRYNLITKIKLIGDIYMAASGLFNQNDPPEEHAEQTVKFAIDFLGELDDINLKLNSNLSVRIGINSGGPIIAGVLGKDKPVFDIIGDPINIAARLQTTDEHNHIQISSDTYELVKGAAFNIEQRGEVFLKGKGKRMTYYISSVATLLAQISSNEFACEKN